MHDFAEQQNAGESPMPMRAVTSTFNGAIAALGLSVVRSDIAVESERANDEMVRDGGFVGARVTIAPRSTLELALE